jgi:peptide/nickel transport system substrate-binding protein
MLAAPASGASTRRDVVVFGIGSIPATAITSFNGTSAIAYAVGDQPTLRGAFRQDNRGRWVKDLVTNARATRRTLSYTISPKAFWYWGGGKVPVTYKDFVYTLQQVDTATATAGTLPLDTTHFVHKGMRQVTFFWRTTNCTSSLPCGPVANWKELFSVAPGIYPSFALKGEDFNKIWTNCICGADGKPVADGPFYLESYSPSQGTVLRRNPYWGGKKPALREVEFKFVEPGALIEAMRHGDVDMIGDRVGPDISLFANVPGITVTPTVSYVFEHLELREGNAPGAAGLTKGASNGLLRAPWMRHALALGINRAALTRALFGRFAKRIRPDENLVFLPTEAAYRRDFAAWDYNPDKAVQILERHCDRGTGPSSPRASNDKIWRCGGVPASFRWTWSANNPTRTLTESIAKSQLRAIGINVIDAPVPSRSFFAQLASGDYDIADFAVEGSGDPGDYYDIYRCGGATNFTGFCSAKVDALLAAGNSELDPQKRTRDFQRADELLAANTPVIPLYQALGVYVHKSGLVGVTGPIEGWHWKR